MTIYAHTFVELLWCFATALALGLGWAAGHKIVSKVG